MNVQTVIRAAAMIAAMMAGVAITAHAQMGPNSFPADSAWPVGRTSDRSTRVIRKKMDKAADVERQKQLESDTAKLLALANELLSALAKAGSSATDEKPNRYSDTAKKVEEIEKLAQEVKQKMRGEV